jgi:hypothetical protein
MKRTVQVLSVTTLVLACTTLYYGQALFRERARSDQATYQTRSAPAAPGQTYAAPAAEPGSAAGTPGLDSAACPDPARIAAARERLQQHTDPARRHEILASNRASLGQRWQQIAFSMQLSAQELEPVLDMLAGQAMEFDQARLECQVNPQCPPCDLRKLNESLRDAGQQNLADHLGPQRWERYEAWRHAITERVYMDELRKRLTGNDALGDEAAERLVLALAQERRKFIEQAAQQGKRVQVSGAGFAVQEFRGDTPPPPFGANNWQLTAAFNQLVTAKAAQHLSPAQMKAFTKMQEERLSNARLMEQLTR